jgi:malonate-semialdehyde dehydrogenase (acetylating)/methylmalonate-semialdehyde dehydrogenase
MAETLKNFVNGEWRVPKTSGVLSVQDPGTGEEIALVPACSASEVDEAAQAAAHALESWRKVPAADRVQYLFKLKSALEKNIDDLSRTITKENGKTLAEAKGEIARAIDNADVATGMPILMQGDVSENIAKGIDEYMIRQPVGVTAIIAPFNFPAMIPFWFFPYALAAGNTVIVKPSERCPMTMARIMELIKEVGFPPGVINLVNGDSVVANALIDHPAVAALSFVGSTRVAQHIYAQSAARGKRVQAQGGAKNPLVIMPDANPEASVGAIIDSVFGNAGQRCLAASLVITVGEAEKTFTDRLVKAAESRKVGYGLEKGIEMGPVISPLSKTRIQNMIDIGVQEGAKLLLDGRGIVVSGFEKGNFLGPTILSKIAPDGKIFQTEIFGPVMGLMSVNTLDDAIRLVNSGKYGNSACIFTTNGAAAQKFRTEAVAGNIGINIGVAAPMAFFPFSGWKDSFFGTLHGQARHAVEFFTQTKVIIERWIETLSRSF